MNIYKAFAKYCAACALGLGLSANANAVDFPQLEILASTICDFDVDGITISTDTMTGRIKVAIDACVPYLVLAPGVQSPDTGGPYFDPDEPLTLTATCDVSETECNNGKGSLTVGDDVDPLLTANFENFIVTGLQAGNFSADLTYTGGSLAGTLLNVEDGGAIGGAFNATSDSFAGKLGPVLAALGDRVWVDLDRDGIQDCTDTNGNGILGDVIPGLEGIQGLSDQGDECGTGVGGVEVELFTFPDGATVCGSGSSVTTGLTTTTDDQGFYLFAPIEPGEYCVVFTEPAGFACTLANATGDPAYDMDINDSDGVDQGDGTCSTGQIVLPTGSDRTWDLGLVPVVSLGDRVWEDLDTDGIQDCTDGGINGTTNPPLPDGIIGNAGDDGDECGTGIAEVEVELYESTGGNTDICSMDDGDTFITSQLTDADGFYLFEDLEPGDYCVVFIKPTSSTHPKLCFDDTYGSLGEPQFTQSGVGGDERQDSNADQDTGETDAVTLDAGDVNLNVDAGIVCPAKIGDFVWSDEDGDGLQDSEPGVEGVTVELWDCGKDGMLGGDGDNADSPFDNQSRTTDSSGMYMFGAEPGIFDLPPGSYFVKFIKPEGTIFTLPGEGDGTNDSHCMNPDGISSCVTLGSGEVNVTRDCGLTETDCGLGIEKGCRVEPEPTVSFDKCDGKLKQFTVVWKDPAMTTINLTGVNMGSYTTSGGGNSVAFGDEVVFSGPYSDNDVEVSFSGGGEFGQSVFHMSCSDEDFNDPSDCGNPAGDGKDESGFDNLWTLEGFIDDSGRVLDCNPENGDAFTESCEFTRQPAPSCENLDPDTLTWRYDGGGNSDGDCSGSTFDIQKDFKCSGSVDPGVAVTVTPDSGSPVNVDPDGEFTISLSASKEMTLENAGGEQNLELHTSCSQPIEVGLTAGALTLVAMDGQDGGAGVTYQYTVSNTGALPRLVTVYDDPLGQIGAPFTLAAGGTEILTTDVIRITETTTNVATASDGPGCSATSDLVIVTANVPTCDVAAVFDKLDKGEKLKYKLTNTSSIVATLETLVVNFPVENGTIKEVKLDKAIYKASESMEVFGPGDMIELVDWTQTDVSKRELDPGETRTLEIVFSSKYEGDDWLTIPALGVATFEETCSVEFPDLPACAFGKPTALKLEYTGALCSATSNYQDGKFDCTDSGSLGDLVDVTMDKDANKFKDVSVIGNTVTITYNDKPGDEMPSEIKYTIEGSSGTQSQVLHTSCSKPLAVDDIFGGLILSDVDLAY